MLQVKFFLELAGSMGLSGCRQIAVAAPLVSAYVVNKESKKQSKKILVFSGSLT